MSRTTIMISEAVTFYSDGRRLSGIWRTRNGPQGGQRVVIQGPGWLGLKDAKMYEPYHEAMVKADISVLIFDYAGFGESEGGPGEISLSQQIRDLKNAVAYACSRDDVLSGAIGFFGSGATGGGHAIVVAADDDRIKAVAVQHPICDGARWLRGLRGEPEWHLLCQRIEASRARRVQTGHDVLVDPRAEITPPTPERTASRVKEDVDGRRPARVPLRIAEELIDYRPIDFARRLTVPLLTVTVEEDDMTPMWHARALHDACRGEKRLITLRRTTHYASYARYSEFVAAELTSWFQTHLRNPDVICEDTRGQPEYLTGL